MFNDRVTLVTGGGTVVGKAIGVQLAKNGSKVALASRDPAHLSASSSGPSSIPQYRDVHAAGIHSLLHYQAWNDRLQPWASIRAIQGKKLASVPIRRFSILMRCKPGLLYRSRQARYYWAGDRYRR
jgi:NAD(P)-dependent dehydrogenase (short-subunit alcohol dehydrogenase family)